MTTVLLKKLTDDGKYAGTQLVDIPRGPLSVQVLQGGALRYDTAPKPPRDPDQAVPPVWKVVPPGGWLEVVE